MAVGAAVMIKQVYRTDRPGDMLRRGCSATLYVGA